MKKLFIPLTLSLFLTTNLQANNIETEAVDSLSTAQNFVQDGNYSKAVEEINYALAKINELTATELLKFIPPPPDGYSLLNKQSQGVGAGASIAGNAGATAEYASTKGATINLNIAIGGMTGKMASFAALGSIFAGLSQESGEGQTRKVRIQGYTGTEIYNSSDQTGTLTFQVGQKASVTFEGNTIQSTEELMQFAKSFDFAGLEKTF
ncbi:MAG: hypothetical protein GY702_14740 [Desulfobulbaceae bacterium]|nr:hypothetical protein [Desulfobulbaceae bacterium]